MALLRHSDFSLPPRRQPRAAQQRRPSGGSLLRSRGWSGIMLMLLAGVLLRPLPAHGQPFHEKEVQSVFLFNFAQFVEWPAAAFRGPAAPIIIGVLGDDPILPHLEKVVANEKVHDRPLVVKPYRRVQDIDVCHILFISPDTGDLDQILREMRERNTLTVSDLPRFVERGGMIQLHNRNNRIRLRINLAAIRAAKLTMSSQLLRLAEIVGPAP